MATSGTVGQSFIDVADIIDKAIRRCGVQPNMLTPETTQIVTDNLFMLLTTLANRGINMWRVHRSLMGLYANQAEYTMAQGTLDILYALYRMPQRLSGTVVSSAGGTATNATDGDIDTLCTQVSPNGNISWDFTDPVVVNSIGILAGATASYTLVFEVSDDDVVWTQVGASPGATAYTNGRWQWYDIEPADSARYFRVRETGGGTLSVREVFVTSTWTEITMARLNRDEYSALPNKRLPGQALQFWFDRQITPKMVLWPMPNTTFTLMSLYTHRQIEDVGVLSNTLDIPQRWYEAVVTGLAFNSVLELPGADLQRYETLKDQANMAMTTAEAEERDASPTQWQPNISPYTA